MAVAFFPRALLAGIGFIVGSLSILWWTAVSMAWSGTPSLAGRPELSHALINEQMVERAVLRPQALPADQTARLRVDTVAQPLDALPFFLLATSVGAAGDRTRAAGLIDAALLRDPRSGAALAVKMQETYAAHRFAATADYALELLAIRSQDSRALDFVVFLSGIPEARARVFAALTHDPDWRSGYISALSTKYGKTSFVYEAIQIGNPVAINLASERAKLLTDLIAQRDYERAYTAWVSWLPADAMSSIDYLYDGNFAGKPGSTPFNWLFENSDKVTTSIEPGGLSVNVDGSVDVMPATQMILLPPGRYQLVTTLGAASVTGSDAGSPFTWQVRCAEQSQLLVETPFPLSKSAGTFAGSAFDIPATCTAQTVELHAKGQVYPVRTLVTIKSIAVRKVA